MSPTATETAAAPTTEAPLIARNPATGAELARIETTPPGEVPAIVDRARQAQAAWEQTPWPARRDLLRRWWSILSRDAPAWTAALRSEIGKPTGEAAGEVLSTLDQFRWTVRHAGRALADERLPRRWQRVMLIPPARQRWRPYGVIGILGTWNYPLFLNAPAIAHALAAGNAVVWKPSEQAPLVGRMLQTSLESAGLPEGLVGCVQGGPEVGRALVESRIDKGQFTGGIVAGRRVLASLAERGIPAIAELSGYDPAIILPDAPFAPTVDALTWSAFVGAGQTCITVKRIYVVGPDAPRWAEALAARAKALRVGDPAGPTPIDLGPLISEAARERFDAYIRAAESAGARILTGGRPLEGPGHFYAPTVLLADATNPAPEAALAGCFGPVILIRGVPDAESAIAAANASEFALGASVWGRCRRHARAIADRLQAGMVTINDAVAPSAHAWAPFGGMKSSGHGRVHGVAGLREYAQPQTLHTRRAGGFRPQLYPYAPSKDRVMDLYRRLFHRQV